MHKHLRRDDTRGFTIVELLIVIVVIAILASISIVAYSGLQKRAKNTARIQTASMFRKGLDILLVNTPDISSMLVAPVDPSFPTACYSKGLPDINGNGTGDCVYSGSYIIASETPAFDAAMSVQSSKIPAGAVYPPIALSDGTRYLSPFIYRAYVNGVLSFLIEYSLEGDGEDCKLGPLVESVSANNYNLITNGQKYSGKEDSNRSTFCIIKVAEVG